MEIAAALAAAGTTAAGTAATAGSAIASAAAASTLAQGVMMGAAIGGGLPALTGGNRHEILRGALAGGVTGGVGAGISGLAGGQTMAQLLGTEAAGAGAGVGGGIGNLGIDPSAVQMANQMALYDPSTLASGVTDISTVPQPNLAPSALRDAGVSSQEAMRELGSLPSKTALNTMSNLQPAYTPPGTNLFDNPLKYGMENLKGVVVPSALAGAMAGQPQAEMPTEDDRYNPLRRQRWGTGTYRWSGAQGGIASLPGSSNFSNYDLLVGDTDSVTPRMMAGGGEADLGSYSDGGRMLRGPGDGMSDSIPGVIANKRPAQLADGEFVVPADVVSHLGNGSTDAGARQLYAMMDKVRKARTGTKRQGREINPRQFVPA